MSAPDPADLRWLDRDGAEIGCTEKRRVLAANLAEFDGVLRDLWEDAILMGVGADGLRRVLLDRVGRLASPHRP